MIAACVVGASLLAIVNWIPRMREIGTDFETEGVRLAAGIIGDSLMLVQFIPLITRAVLWRGRPARVRRGVEWTGDKRLAASFCVQPSIRSQHDAAGHDANRVNLRRSETYRLEKTQDPGGWQCGEPAVYSKTR